MATYQVPPWIRPAETERSFLSGMSLGASAAQASQRLAMQRELSAMETAVKSRQLEMEAEERRQRLNMDDAYQQQMIGLKERQLAEQTERAAMEAEMAGRRFAAQTQFQARVQAGEDPSKVMLEMGPVMGASAGDFGAALRATTTKATPPPGPIEAFPVMFQGKPVGGLLSVPTATGGTTTREIPGYKPEGMSSGDRGQAARYLMEQRRELIDSLPPEKRTPEQRPQWLEQTKAVRERIDELDRKIRALLPALGDTATNAPAASAAEPTTRIVRDPATGRFKVVRQ